jgi:tripartite-type tricarboxylate transporter receptor subunit TctC
MRIIREVQAVIQPPEFKKRLVDIGQEPVEPLTGEAFGNFIRAEAARWRELAAIAGVKDE